MTFNVKFEELNTDFKADFGEVTDINAGVYDAGFNAGKETGYKEGYNDGKEVSYDEGHADGYNNGYTEGKTAGIEQGIEQGKQAEYDKFWDALQQNGKRTVYLGTFSYSWTDKDFRPKYDMRPTSLQQCFQLCNITNLKQAFDNAGCTLDTSNCTNLINAFHNTNIRVIPTLQLAENINMNVATNVFSANNCLHTIEKIIMPSTARGSFHNTFFGSLEKLENIVIEGEISVNGFWLGGSPLLTHDSLMSIINALSDKSADASGTDWKITIGSTNLAKLTEKELQIAYDKGWQVV